MPRLVLKANQIEAEATVAERRFAGALPHGFTALSRIVALKPSPVLQRSHRRVPRPPLLLDVLVTGCWCGGSKRVKPVGEELAIFSEAGADTQTELMIPPRPAYDTAAREGTDPGRLAVVERAVARPTTTPLSTPRLAANIVWSTRSG